MDIDPSKKGESPQLLTYQSLLFGIKMPENPPFTLSELKTELYRRIKNRLYQYCQRLCLKNRLDDSIAKEITQVATLKGFESINSFNFENDWTELKCSNKIAAWFNKIATNLYNDILKKKAQYVLIEEYSDDIEDDGSRPDDYEFEVDDTIELRLQDAMDSLNDKERYLINICLKHNCLGNNNHLPDEVIDEVCDSLRIKKGHDRVIKLRALRKLRAKLEKSTTKTKSTAN